ncbi:GntR family transcriptional regulator [Mesorhizobium sp. J18]|uniref:GntR family transcriptional regulator n=1 Tax=Mesorhizobium sp. J18 TaxID=935263 RepID=UPI0016462C7B|nr:GntR family transcriptional regulator [Mesorhizobium sp. J18]
MSREASLAQAQHVIRSIVASRHDRPSLVAQIACEIGAEIVEAIIPPGHDLNTVELARRYQTSRTPVREALILLENEGLVDIPPRRRPRAHVHTMIEVSEVYRTRTVLFELMATDSAKRATEADIEVLRGILARMQQAAELGDITAFSWLSVEFHDFDTRLSGNTTAKRIHDSLLLRSLAIRRLSLSQPTRMARSLEDHIQLVKAYENHDSNLAGAILRANHTAALASVEHYFQKTGTLTLPHAVAAQPEKNGEN